METKNQAGITFVGLGSGDPELLTRQAWNWLQGAAEIAVRAGADVEALATEQAKLLRLGEVGDASEEQMLTDLLDLARQPGGITYAAPGAPFEGDRLASLARERAVQEGLAVYTIGGVSLFDAARGALGNAWAETAVHIDAHVLTGLHMPPFPPNLPALIVGIDGRDAASQVVMALTGVYPASTLLTRVAPGAKQGEAVALEALDRQENYNSFAVWRVPALGAGTALEDFQEIVAALRAPNGCPWDREQTHLSLRTHLLEETYEALEALDAQDVPGMVEEFGDLLLQIVLHAQIAAEAGEFHMADVVQGINDKIIRRHPHVFGDVQVDGVTGVLQNWERLKAAERVDSPRKAKKKGLLDGVPPVFPSLAQAQEIQDRAARVNFDWLDIDGVIAKVNEELEEVKSAADEAALTAEIGDLLFAVVNLARWEKVDAESALRETNARFRRRFDHIEASALEKEIPLDEVGLDEMNRLWDEAKRQEKGE
ncbi:MAG TPA: nucleoside triphosphate pyrophosphohydrolase [Anaerolineaceae bacterium]